MSQIFYNGVDAFSPQPSPIVTRGLTPLFRGDGRRLGYLDKYTLVGSVTGCTMEKISGAMASILSTFSRDFHTMQFVDTNFTGQISGIRIDAINFEQTNQVGIQPYTIEITSYPESFFESNGILEKRNEWSMQQTEKGELTLNHTIFARGFNTSTQYNNALTNAKNFVLQYTGLPLPALFPFFISGFSGATIDTRTENINRLEGTYTITEGYVANTGSNVVKDYTINLESGTDGIITTSINGSFRAGKGVDFDVARQAYSGFNSFRECSGVYTHYRSITGLVENPFLSSGVTEDYTSNTLNFDISFNDWPQVKYRHVPTVQVSSGIDGIITIGVNGRIEGLGKLQQRYDNAYQFWTGLNIFNVANQAYNDYVGINYLYSLSQYPIESGTTDNRFIGTIEYNNTFTNKSKALDCTGIKIFDVQISKTYAMPQIAPVSIPKSFSGLDTVFLDYLSRGTIEAQGSVFVDKNLSSIDATGVVRQYINGKFRREILASGSKTKIRLENINLNQNINTDSCTFSVVYSFDEPACVNTSSSFLFITGLQI